MFFTVCRETNAVKMISTEHPSSDSFVNIVSDFLLYYDVYDLPEHDDPDFFIGKFCRIVAGVVTCIPLNEAEQSGELGDCDKCPSLFIQQAEE